MFRVGDRDIHLDVIKKDHGNTIFQKLVEIISVHNFIVEQPILPEWRDDIQKMEFIRAIQGTLALEGSELEIEDVERIADQDVPSLDAKDKEAENALKAYEFIQQWSHDNEGAEITESVIRQIHTSITRGIDYYLNTPGEYRNQPVTFGIPKKQSGLRDKFEVADAMGRLVQFINQENEPLRNYGGHPFTKAIIAHYLMTFIHPFIDGNGRVSRAVEALILYHYGKIENFFFPISAKFYYSERRKYFTLLREVDDTCDPYPFVIYALDGLLGNLIGVKEQLNNKITETLILDYAHQLRRQKKLLKRQTNLLQVMFYLGPMEVSEFWNHPAIKGIYDNLSPSTRKRDIRNLIELDFITVNFEGGKVKTIIANWDLLKSVKLRLGNIPQRPSL